MKAVHNDPARRLLLKLTKPALIDLVLELLRKGSTRAVSEAKAHAVLAPIAALHDIDLPEPRAVASCVGDRCCVVRR